MGLVLDHFASLFATLAPLAGTPEVDCVTSCGFFLKYGKKLREAEGFPRAMDQSKWKVMMQNALARSMINMITWAKITLP